MITVHHLETSRSHRVLWLLEELGVPYDIVRYARDPATMRAPAALQKIHPLGKSPVIADGGKTIAESGAIMEYIVETYGAGRMAPPRGTDDRLRYTYWLHYAEGSAMPLLLLKLVFMRMPKGKLPFWLRPVVKMIAKKGQDGFVDPQLAQHVAYWESELAARPWFAGAEFSAADIQMSYPVEAAVARLGLGAGAPKLTAFVQRIRARPAYQRAEAAGGPMVAPA